MIFNKGDKLVCIKAGDPSIGLVKGKIYTCFNSFTNNLGEDTVEVLKSMPPEPYHGYRSVRFRKALPVDLKTLEKQETI